MSALREVVVIAAGVTLGILVVVAIMEGWEVIKRWRRDRRFEREHAHDEGRRPRRRR